MLFTLWEIIFPRFVSSDRLWDRPLLIFNGLGIGDYFEGMMWPVRELDHSFPCSVGVKNRWDSVATSLYIFLAQLQYYLHLVLSISVQISEHKMCTNFASISFLFCVSYVLFSMIWSHRKYSCLVTSTDSEAVSRAIRSLLLLLHWRDAMSTIHKM